MSGHPIRLTRTPSTALAALLRSASFGADPLDALSALSGVQRRDITAIVRRERVLKAEDAEELGSIAGAAGVPMSWLSYGATMERMYDEDGEDGDEYEGDEDKGEDEDEAVLRMEDDEPRRYGFVMSTADADRARDVVGQTWALQAFRANPVAPWGHDASMPPIGLWEGVTVRDGRLRGTLVAHGIASYPLSMTVAEQLKRGILRAVSVGFLPGQAVPRRTLGEDHPLYAERGYYFDRNELLECSVVSVPMNAAATMEPMEPVGRQAEQAPVKTFDWLSAPAQATEPAVVGWL